MRYQDIWELYESGDLDAVIQMFDDIDALDTIHTAMFENALDAGVSEETLKARISDVNFEMGRKHMLDDRDVAYLTRSSMMDFSKEIGVDIMRGQIRAIAETIKQHLDQQ